jgi:hypothetical protein
MTSTSRRTAIVTGLVFGSAITAGVIAAAAGAGFFLSISVGLFAMTASANGLAYLASDESRCQKVDKFVQDCINAFNQAGAFCIKSKNEAYAFVSAFVKC